MASKKVVLKNKQTPSSKKQISKKVTKVTPHKYKTAVMPKLKKLISKPLKIETLSKKYKQSKKPLHYAVPKSTQPERIMIEKQVLDIKKPSEQNNTITQNVAKNSEGVPKFEEQAHQLFHKPEWYQDSSKVEAEINKISERIEHITPEPVQKTVASQNTQLFTMSEEHEDYAKQIVWISIGVVVFALIIFAVFIFMKLDPYIDEGVCSASIVTVQEGIEIRVPIELPSTQCHKIFDCQEALRALKFEESSVTKMRLRCEDINK